MQDFRADQDGLPVAAAAPEAFETLGGLASREDLLARLERIFDLELLEAAKLHSALAGAVADLAPTS